MTSATPLRHRARRLLPVLLAVSAGTLLAVSAYAATGDLGLSEVNPGLSTTDIRTVIGNVIRAFLGLTGIIMVCLMMYAGWLWMTAGGRPEQIEKAKHTMTSAIIGLLIILMSYAIVVFVARMLGISTGSGGSYDNCPSGGCADGGGIGGSGNAFSVLGYMPLGAGPNGGGWPHDYPIRIVFNGEIDPATLDLTKNATAVTVEQCNNRTGDFTNGSCSGPIPIKVDVVGDTAIIHAVDAKGEVIMFEGEKWYKVRVMSGVMGGAKSISGQSLQCGQETEPLDSTKNLPGYCARAVAFNNLTDSQAPTVYIEAPSYWPALCQGSTRKADVVAVAKDDWLVGSINYLLDGGTAAFVPVVTTAKESNVSSTSPTFTSRMFSINPTLLSEGKHQLTASAEDLAGKPSNVSGVGLTVVPGHCCNTIKDADETGVDCGGVCGKCDGDTCATNSECASGFCDPKTNRCSQRAVIESVKFPAAGPGSLVTVAGQHFGSAPGSIVFLGDINSPDDDVISQACNSAAWKDGEIVVQVPDGAKSGPLEVRPGQGLADRTDDDFGPRLTSVFTVNTDRKPGICFLDPSSGPAGSPFMIHGNGFGAPSAAAKIFFGAYSGLPIATGGWGDQSISTTVPAAPSGDYDVLLNLAGATAGTVVQSNSTIFNIPELSAATGPRVGQVTPENGPPGTYVTIRGSGFGTRAGTVKFKYGGDANVAIGADTACGVNWHDDYIIVKIPEVYGGSVASPMPIQAVAHAVVVETLAPTRSSNDTVKFTVTSGVPGPGICAIEPDNGPPGTPVTLKGERFGNGSSVVSGVDFTMSSEANRCLLSISDNCAPRGSQCPTNGGLCVKEPMRQSASTCQTWSDTSIATSVPGVKADKAKWPASGDVWVVAGGHSDNSVPFKVQDCNNGGTCKASETCCGSGSCVQDPKSCQSQARNSAYGLLMSTEAVPEMPQVLERPYCSTTGTVPLMQSPSPFRDQQDACNNGAIYLEFTRGLASLGQPVIGTDVIVEECAPVAGADKPSTDCKPVVWNPSPSSWSICGGGRSGMCGLRLNPVLAANKWYRVRLVSQVTDAAGKPLAASKKIGLHELAESGGRYLDGDFNRYEGGDYIYTFKTRSLDAPCAVTGTMVNPQNAILRKPLITNTFMLELLSGCNVLQCTPSTSLPFAIGWDQSPQTNKYLDLKINPGNDESPCLKPVIGAQETPGGSPSTLFGYTEGAPSITSQSRVTVKFTDPKVIRVSPISGCMGACSNGDIYAQFNVPMDRASLERAGNVTIKQCRNASCLAPLADVTCTPVRALPGDSDVAKGDNDVSRVQLSCGELAASSYYVVRISNDVKSFTFAPLTGLNYGNYYQWIFRTKDPPDQKCTIDSVSLDPETVTLHYVGERAGLKTIARAKKDACSSAGQELNPWLSNWKWGVAGLIATFSNPVISGFVKDAATPSLTNFLDTDPTKIPASCTGNCLTLGSSVPAHVCGDGRADNQRFRLNAEDSVGPEGCDPSVAGAGDWCGTKCTMLGVKAPTCGNGTMDAGEECEKDSVTGLWPIGCKAPGVAAPKPAAGSTDPLIATERGCVWLGAIATKSFLRGTTACAKAGDAGCCGNGAIDTNEQCDMTPDTEGAMKFQGNCKQPGEEMPASGVAKDIGCVLVDPRGSRLGCGDGVLGDGEQCDDGNTNDLDGCSSECLFEGSKPACGTSPTAGCLNVCGNHVTETGEDAGCDVPGSTPAQNNCDPVTCKHLGTPLCTGTVDDLNKNCCGNGKIGAGEDAECEDSSRSDRSKYCTTSCLLKGSSFTYEQGSFCGDTVKFANGTSGSTATGSGEKASCELAKTDSLIDPVQYVQGEPQASFDPKANEPPGVGVTSRVTATVDGVSGTADVKMQCNCRENRNEKVDQDAYCSTFGAGKSVKLGCGTDSCCRPRPTVVLGTTPPICRNGAIQLTFDQPMDQASLVQAIEVGVDSGVAFSLDTATDAGSPCGGSANRFSVAAERPSSWWGRLWHGLVVVVRSFFGLPAEAAGNWYCRVKAEISASYGEHAVGETIYPTTVYINQLNAYPGKATVRVRVSTVAKSVWGVSMQNDWSHDVETKEGMCTLVSVDIAPSSLLINDINVPDYPVRALARGARPDKDTPGPIIVPVEEYKWTWSWEKKNFSAPADPIVVSPRSNSVTGAELDVARVHARNPKLGDAPSDFVPKNDTDDITVTAKRILDLPSSATAGTIEKDVSGSARAYVMPCDNPWPKMYQCESLKDGNGNYVMPWGQSVSCQPGSFWTPYQNDKTYGLSTYYCRDDKRDAAKPAGTRLAALPAIAEKPANITPGRDIIGEFLFTYDLNLSGHGAWDNDAIGWRINTNPNHGGLMPWYRSKGFTGTPAAKTIAGYETLEDGRSTYMSFAYANQQNQYAAGKSVYTNVATFTYSDGASAETQEVFSQLMANLDVNSDMSESRTCKSGVPGGGAPNYAPLLCASDSDCWADDNGTILAVRRDKYTCDKKVGFCAVKGAAGAAVTYDTSVGLTVPCDSDLACRTVNGAYVPERDGYTCDAAKTKLARDIKRWADLLSMRAYLLESLGKTGAVPRLNVGTYVTGSTTSVWPSWKEYLYPALGGALVNDPINQHGRCTGGTMVAGFDGTSCWNANKQEYTCPSGSHVYQYQGLGGQDFVLRSDFESPSGNSWQGQNCPELSGSNCAKNPDCTSVNGRCVYKIGNLDIGNLNGSSPLCTSSILGVGGVCGDGIIDSAVGEACEVNNTKVEACCVPAGNDGTGYSLGVCGEGTGRTGTLNVSCNACQWAAAKKCLVGSCGDGKLQPSEACDDGSLNGKYGYCNSTCTGASTRCGDGQRQPNEACDCGANNGKYSFNAIVSTDMETNNGSLCPLSDGINAPSCGWDCQAPAPRCGDGIVSEQEQCDGGRESFKGYCGDAAKTGCNTNQDCPAGSACKTGTQVCPQPEQTVHRSCLGNNAASTDDDGNACTWGVWSCTEPGSCGDGVVQSGEECDDGDAKMGDNTSCLKTGTVLCKRNKCGDGFINRAGGEECDTAAQNGKLTPAPDYGFTKNYCTTSCKLSTVSGGFCGDNVLQDATVTPPGPEKCEQGIGMSDFVCISINANELCKAGSMKTEPGACNAKCEPGCADPNARPCKNEKKYSADGQTVTNDNDGDGIVDECDPDDDNDGVPDSSDCASKDFLRHPAYRPGGNSSCDIAATPEYCDGIDNDCNGFVDDDWVLTPRPEIWNWNHTKKLAEAQPGAKIKGQVVDAFFPKFVRDGVTVRVARKLCSVDKRTSCEQDKDCKTLNLGTCGVTDLKRTTDNNGYYDFGNNLIRFPSQLSPVCKMKIQVDELETWPNIQHSFWPSVVDPLEDRKLGYFQAKLDIDTDSPECVFDPDKDHRTCDEKIYLVPKPPAGMIVAAFLWDNALSTYLDAWLKKPGSDYVVNPIGYANQGQHSLTENPWARVICNSSDAGNPTSCGSFSEAPEIFMFASGGAPDIKGGDRASFVVDPYNCVENCKTLFTSPTTNARVYIAFTNSPHCDETSGTKYGEGCSTDADCGSGKCKYYEFCDNGKRASLEGCTSTYPGYMAVAPPGGQEGDPVRARDASGNGRSWHVFDWVRQASGNWGWEIPNTFTDTPPFNL